MSTTAQLENTTTLGGPESLMAQGRTFPWHQIFGASQQASVDFYTQAFDWGTTDFPMGENGNYKMLTANGSPVAGVLGTEDSECLQMKGIPPHWAVSIGVDNVDVRIKKCTDLGGIVLQPGMDIPTVGRVALLQDTTRRHLLALRASRVLVKPEGSVQRDCVALGRAPQVWRFRWPSIAADRTWSHDSINEIWTLIHEGVIKAKPIVVAPLGVQADQLDSGTSAVLGASLSERTKTATR